jgi:hypothetical protein
LIIAELFYRFDGCWSFSLRTHRVQLHRHRRISDCVSNHAGVFVDECHADADPARPFHRSKVQRVVAVLDVIFVSATLYLLRESENYYSSPLS